MIKTCILIGMLFFKTKFFYFFHLNEWKINIKKMWLNSGWNSRHHHHHHYKFFFFLTDQNRANNNNSKYNDNNNRTTTKKKIVSSMYSLYEHWMQMRFNAFIRTHCTLQFQFTYKIYFLDMVEWSLHFPMWIERMWM